MDGELVIVTLEDLRKQATRAVALPGWSREAGAPRGVIIRKLRPTEMAALRPQPIPGAEDWAEADRPARLRGYLESLSDDARRARAEEWEGLTWRILQVAVLQPALSPDDARLFSQEDAEAVVVEVLRFSQLVPASADAPA